MNELNYTCNLSAGLRMTPLKAALVQGETNAHTLEIAFEKDARRTAWIRAQRLSAALSGWIALQALTITRRFFSKVQSATVWHP